MCVHAHICMPDVHIALVFVICLFILTYLLVLTQFTTVLKMKSFRKLKGKRNLDYTANYLRQT